MKLSRSSKSPCSQQMKRIFGASLVIFLMVYIFVVFGFIPHGLGTLKQGLTQNLRRVETKIQESRSSLKPTESLQVTETEKRVPDTKQLESKDKGLSASLRPERNKDQRTSTASPAYKKSTTVVAPTAKRPYSKSQNTDNSLLTFYGHPDLLKSPETFRPRKQKVNPLNFTYTISSLPTCPSNKQTTLFILVLTQHEHFPQRKAIRDTWGRITKDEPWPGRKLHGTVKLVFLLGDTPNKDLNDKVLKESEEYKDIIQANFKDSYFNLTLKVLLGMKWIHKNCPNTQFVMKIDDDAFSDIPRIMNILVSTSMTNTIYGAFAFADTVVRENSKALVSLDAYPLKYYPPHVKGNMYVMPYKLAMNILKVSEYIPYVNIEDAHITGILAKVFDARHINIPDNLYERYPKKDPDVCDFVNEKRITAQKIYPSLLYKIWSRIEEDDLCELNSLSKT